MMPLRLLIAGLATVGIAAVLVGAQSQRLEARNLKPKVPVKPTYADHVAKILNDHCVECHRPGEVAPFSLVGYDNAKKWATMAASVTQSKRMPPWKAVHGFNEFQDENRLEPEEVEILKRWNAAGAPRGDKRKEPKAPTFPTEWPAGTPDIVLKMDQPFTVPAEGADIYRNFVMRNDFSEAIWVNGMTVKPGNSKVVHHVIAFLDKSGRAAKLESDSQDGKPGYATFGGPGFLPSGSLGGWAPGLRTRILPTGRAFKIDPGEKVVLQIHYHPTGKQEVDQTRVGLYTSKAPVTDQMHLRWVLNPVIAIPPGAKEHKVNFESKFWRPVTIYGVMPHMHLLGRSMKAWVELPDGMTKPLVYISDWDFNWQLQYLLKEPMKLPRGSKVKIEAIYDNSTDNPNNPSNPPKWVRFGEETTDEMFLLVIAHTEDEP